jgi:ABC-type phosphate transport system permease subunit
MSWNQNKKEKRREAIFKLIAFIFAVITLFAFLLLPMYIFRVIQGIPLDAKGPGGEVWFLIVGGGLGAGAAYLVSHFILVSLGGFSEDTVNRLWRGTK